VQRTLFLSANGTGNNYHPVIASFAMHLSKMREPPTAVRVTFIGCKALHPSVNTRPQSGLPEWVELGCYAPLFHSANGTGNNHHPVMVLIATRSPHGSHTLTAVRVFPGALRISTDCSQMMILEEFPPPEGPPQDSFHPTFFQVYTMGHALDHSLISLGELGGPAGFTHEAPNTH